MSDNNNIQNEIQEENKAENRRQASQDEVIAPFKEISYDYFLANKKLNKKCCSCCCVLKAYQSIDNYINNKIEMEKVFIDQKKLCCFKNVLMINFITLIWDFLLNIPNLYICFHLKPEFKKLKNKKKGFRLLESHDKSDEYFDQWFDTDGFDLLYANIQPKFKLWYRLINSEIIFSFFLIIFDILFFIFLLFQIRKYYKIITEKEKKQGKITKYIILGNFIFFILYLIMTFLSFYFFIFSIFVLASKTFEDRTMCILKIICLMFRTILFFNHYFGLKNILCFYMDLNYEEKTNNNNEIDIRNEEDKIKTGFLFINYNNIEVDVIANKNLYLEENKQSQNKQNNKVYEFKQIRSNEISAGLNLYIKIKNDAYRNMLSITDWRYGLIAKPEKIYKKLDKLLLHICLLIVLITPPLFFHAKDEEFYNRLRKIIENNIFKIYGDFEYAFSIIRYIIYIIIAAALLLLMYKRIFYGGYIIYKLLKYSNIICHSLNIYNLIIIIFNILLMVFSIKCNSIQSDFIKKNNIANNYTKVFYIQHYYCYFCLIDIIVIIYKINGFRKYLVKLKNDMDNLYKTENEETEIEFQYKGLDGKNHILKEFGINPHPRYLYYFDKDININNINNINDNNNINNNSIEEKLKKEVGINYEHLDSKNKINMEDTKTNNE